MQGFIVTATKSRNKIHRDYWSTIRAESKDEAIRIAKRGTRGLVDIVCYTHAEWDRFNLAHAARVSLAKPEAPECVAHLADVPQESNAAVMERAVAVVRERRLTAEYLAGVDGDVATLDAGISDNEQVRALAAEQARADAARKLCGVALCDIDPMAGNCCETCGAALESGQIGDCDECQEDAPEFINHYKCHRCAHEWADQWTAQCDDDCPECGARHVSPHTSEDA